MKLPFNTTQWATPERLLRWGQIGLAVWLAVMVVGAAAQGIQTSGKAAAAIQDYERIRTEAAASNPSAAEQVRQLVSSNLFVAPPGQSQPPKSQAILGDAVLIGDQWYRQGQTVNGFEIVSIGPEFVTLMRDGKEHRIVPFEVEVSYTPTPGGTTGRPGERGRDGERGMRGRGGPGGGEGGRMPGGPDGARGPMTEMRGRMENLTPDQRRDMYERFRNATPEERERMREQFRQERE